MIEVYHYPKCGTCKKALKWLALRGIQVRLIDIVESPPTLAKLKRAVQWTGLPVAKFFNTSGQSYRAGNYKTRLETMTDAEALTALSHDGKLIKRPLVFGDNFALVGFREADYAARW